MQAAEAECTSKFTLQGVERIEFMIWRIRGKYSYCDITASNSMDVIFDNAVLTIVGLLVTGEVGANNGFAP
jgi:hypothetical protein